MSGNSGTGKRYYDITPNAQLPSELPTSNSNSQSSVLHSRRAHRARLPWKLALGLWEFLWALGVGSWEFPMVRSVIAVIAGWAVFGLSAALHFAFAGRSPHDTPTTAFAIGTTIYGVVFALAAGGVAAALAPGRPIVHAAVVSLVIAAGATAAMLSRPAVVIWSQTAALVLMAPAATVGGALLRSRTKVV